MDDIVVTGDVHDYYPVNLEFHRKLGEMAGNKRLELIYQSFVRELHKRMFDRTWRWAGSFRKTERNLGVAPEQIAPQLRNLLDDARYWLEHTTYSLDECAARFHHRLVSIHCFANGNGRHARLMTDALLKGAGGAPFSWGRGDLVHTGDIRSHYLAALRAADSGDNSPLLAFVRS
jgi:Fic-DOC domain mobile mystery protein B